MKTKLKQKNIPDGWDSFYLKDVADFLDNKRIPLSSEDRQKRQGKYPYYGASGIIDYIDDYIFDDELILLGEDGANIIDRSSRLAFIACGKFWVNNHAHVLKAKNNVLTYYLSEYLEKLDYQPYNTGSAQPKLNRAVCERIHVFLPPLPEQKRIVEVLEVWDSYLEKLAKKIEIKKRIKKGLMQQLLTGKKRLKGFTEPWESAQLGELGRIVSGGTPSKAIDSYWNGNVPWISSSDLIEENITYVKISRYISDDAIANSATKLIPKSSIIMVSRVGIGKLIVNNVPLCTSQDFQSLIIDDYNSHNCFFLAYLLIVKLKQFLLKNQGTSIKGLLKMDLEKLNLNIPSFKEQTTIANILTKADDEIEALEKKKKIIEAQKKYLLNHLITGAIRTPENMKNLNGSPIGV